MCTPVRPLASTVRSHPLSRALAAPALAGAVALALLPATAATATTTSVACAVTSADLAWGFKESFRSYISGSIAHGSWEPVDGADYTTPQFSFTGGTGEVDPAAGTGEVSFGGGIVFTGHDGLLDTTIANPTLEIDGTGAVLRLDISGVSMEDALAGSTEAATVEQVPFVSIDLGGATVGADGSLSVADAPTAITEEGFAAFPNYETGTPFDPITITIAAECATPEPVATTDAAEPAEPAETPVIAAASEQSGGNALPVVIASAAVAVGGAAAPAFAVRRGRRKAADDAAREAASGDPS